MKKICLASLLFFSVFANSKEARTPSLSDDSLFQSIISDKEFKQYAKKRKLSCTDVAEVIETKAYSIPANDANGTVYKLVVLNCKVKDKKYDDFSEKGLIVIGTSVGNPIKVLSVTSAYFIQPG